MSRVESNRVESIAAQGFASGPPHSLLTHVLRKIHSYVGEVLLWTAQFLGSTTALAAPAVAGPLFPAWLAYAAIASPVLEYSLIRFVSGVPMLEVSDRS